MDTQIMQKIEFLNSECDRLLERAEKEIDEHRKTPVSPSLSLFTYDLAFNTGRLHGVLELKIIKEIITELISEIKESSALEYKHK